MRTTRSVLLAAALLAAMVMPAWVTPAAAAVRISGDRGGQIGHYLRNFNSLRSSGQRVIIDGNCLSACTLLLGIIPRSHMCATARARFGFHAAWMPDAEGRPVTNRAGTRILWRIYPRRVRHWIVRHGGLSRHMIYLQGREVYHFVPSCQAEARRHRPVRSRHHRLARRHLRYYAATATDYSR